ncbi:DUF3080 domain-containing protein [Photobacterium sanguinicancri]|uniref:DUF3080 domain-containing protein n=1 Tax=Photobacterium sanguinicancri TaxID=875932 RepID=UPI0026E25B01|nr:DUF3080 domain-containing protein [Photobacterium sanguinicancri]
MNNTLTFNRVASLSCYRYAYLTLRLLALSLSACWMLTGCDNSGEHHFKDYHQRLANVLEVDPIPFHPLDSLPNFPSTRTLYVPVEDIRIGLLDAYELRRCGLFQLIADRNSSLGKVQDKTRQLRYELLLLNGLEKCVTQTVPVSDDNPISQPLIDELTPIKQKKQQQLSSVIWNMLATGKEWRQQFVLYPHTFDIDNFAGLTANLAAMEDILTLLEYSQIQPDAENKPTHEITPKRIDEALANRLLIHQENIHRSRYFGQLFYSIANATQWINITTQLLNQQESTIICGEKRNQQQAEYLKNVFYRFYTPKIQSYLAELDSQYLQVKPVLQQAFNQLPTKHPDLLAYKEVFIDGNLHQSFRIAVLDHTKFWQRTFKRCQFKVGI